VPKGHEKNALSPCALCSKEQWEKCLKEHHACDKLLLWARNLR
jgi:hypothetical protein